jgi:hypothetical protein
MEGKRERERERVSDGKAQWKQNNNRRTKKGEENKALFVQMII